MRAGVRCSKLAGDASPAARLDDLVSQAGGASPSARRKCPSGRSRSRCGPRKMKSMIRSMPPVPRRLVSSSASDLDVGLARSRVFRAGRAAADRDQSGPGDLRRGPETFEIFFRCSRETGQFDKRLRDVGRRLSSGRNVAVVSSAKCPMRSIAGPSCSRNAGNAGAFSFSAALWFADACETFSLSAMKFANWARTPAQGRSALSELTASCVRTLFWLASIDSTFSSSASAGLARLITALRSLPRWRARRRVR